MSVENLEGDGYADQPSIIYAFDGGDELRELSRSGYAELGASPGDVIERESTKSDPSTRLPELELPGERGIKYDDCGDDIPAFACEDCGHPKYVGRTCQNPTCERCWPSAVKDKTVRVAGKLEGMRRMLYSRYDGRKDIDFNHVIASLPDFAVDSDMPLERALMVIKTLLEKQWNIDGFAAIYHPYRIKKEYRKDQYEHGGEPGEGEMTWSDVLTSDDPYKYIYYSPHFHLFFPAIRRSFDYLTAEAVEDQSGWLFHRITKDDSNVSVEDLDDLVHQITYCFSHCGPNDWNADRSELTSRMKGDLHNCYIPDGVEDKVLSSFCDAAPDLLGARFSNVADASCDAEVTMDDDRDDDQAVDGEPCACDDCRPESPLTDVWERGAGVSGSSGSGGMSTTGGGSFGGGSSSGTASSSEATEGHRTTAVDMGSGEGVDAPETTNSPVTDEREECGGDLVPMHTAKGLLDDADWCRSAAYVSGLRVAVAEWEALDRSEDSKPWVEGSGDDDLDASHDVIQGG